MADENKFDIVLKGNVGLWEISEIGDILGTYTGQFEFRTYLTPTQKLAASRLYRELLGPNPSIALQSDDDNAFALAQLKYRVVSAPPFWASSVSTAGIPGDLPDSTVLLKILDAAVATELKYKEHMKEKRIEALKKAKEVAERLLANKEKEDSEGEDQENTD